MELTHSFTVPTSVDDAWALFMDLEKVGGCFPGATVTEVSEESFSGTVKVKLGPIALLYSGSGSFVERDDAAHRAVIEAKGKDKRGNGTAGASVTIELSPDGTGTRADVVTDLAVTGKPAQFGRGVMQDVSDKLLMAFIACIETRLGEGDGGGVEAGAAEAGPAEAGAAEAGVVEAAGAATADGTAIAPEASSGAAAAASPATPVTPGPAAPRPAAYPPGPRLVPSSVEEDDALDLGSAVMPVLVKRYAGYAVAAFVGLVIGILLGRRGND
ncbi:carbon monoxide dehydrogenase subunit G [Humibacillus xanthopallidus]|uniref:Carbon monoxide dehydrogenase subunit G n=1 Tax=Humibacillus xanthopallidus TaxID=412689 RepID=A0A543PKS3_9MICO|nr:SRPBCC family protein [Humibacillus xanthopallidus]TQN44676.1 carbon monoxide dehydrogenase subunit G [Humibacillus xanthopallidus]